MRIYLRPLALVLGIMSAFAVCVATANASIITGTLTGTIGTSGGPSNVTSDPYGIFGPAGANYAGDQITLSFSYNTGLLVYVDNGGQDDDYQASPSFVDGAIAVGVSIGSSTYAYPTPGPSVLYAGEDVADSGPGSSVLGFALSATYNVGGYLQGYDADFELYGTSSLPIGSLADQAAISSFLGTVTTATLFIDNGEGGENIYFTPDASSTSAPEPTAWLLLAAGLCGLALLRRLQPSSFQSARAR